MSPDESPSRRRYWRNVAEVTGASILALLFVGGFTMIALGRLLDVVLAALGVGGLTPLWANVYVIAAVFLSVWASFAVIERLYR